MSILLDAVTRDKQQHAAGVLDPVMTPKAILVKPARSVPYLWVTVVVLAIVVGVISAWLASRYINGASENQQEPQQYDKVSSAPTVQYEAPLREARESPTQYNSTARGLGQTASNEPIPVLSSKPEFKIAARVTLPQPQTLPDERAIGASLSKHASPSNEAKRKALMNSNEGSKAVVKLPVEPDQVEEPIILGANANERGRQQLANLRQQVDTTAAQLDKEEVGKIVKRNLKSSPRNDDTRMNGNNLAAAFEAALKEVERNDSINHDVTRSELDPIPGNDPNDSLPKYGQLPLALQSQVPEFTINAHVYAGSPERRWLNVDGAELQQGDMIDGKLTIIEIRPRDVVLDINGTEFRVPAI